MSENRLRKPVSAKKTASRVLLYVVVIDICLLILYPYFVMFCTALKSRAEIFSINGTVQIGRASCRERV